MQNTPEGLIVSFTLAVALILLILVYMSGTPDSISNKNFLPEKIIVTKVDNIKIGPSSRIEPGLYEHSSISADIKIKYLGELKGEKKIVPIITFNGGSKKAKVLNQGKESDFFIVNSEEQEISIIARNIQGEPRTRDEGIHDIDDTAKLDYKETILERMNRGEKNFTITLVDIGRFSSISHPLECRATFRIACKSYSYYPELYQIDVCDERGDLNKCQASIRAEQMCNSTVILRVEKLDCEEKSAEVYFYASPGFYEYPFEIGDEIGITFFEKSSCTDNYEDVEKIKECGKNVGGIYKFYAPVR